MKRSRVYIAYTGGTIGMKHTAEGYAPCSGYLEAAIRAQPEFQNDSLPQIDFYEYEHLIDSSNTTPEHWNIIAADIATHYDDYDGFVILHGTDTMAYSASALSFLLDNLAKPVIFTGSQIPFAELRSDARDNLIGAVQLAASSNIPEVALYFHNRLYRGNCSSKTDSGGFAAYQSPNFPELAEVGIDIKVISKDLLPQPSNKLKVSKFVHHEIATLHLFPGMSAEVLKNYLRQPVEGLIILTYGAGNIPSHDHNLVQLIEKASKQGIIIVNCSQCLSGTVNMDVYETGTFLSKSGVINARDMTIEASVTKLLWLLSVESDIDKIRHLMATNLRGELRV